MVILIVCIVGLGISIFVGIYTMDSYGWTGWGIVPVMLFGFAVLIISIGLPLTRLDYEGEIEEYYGVQETIERARGNGDNIENYALQQDIIKINKWLKRAQYYNERFDSWIPDEVDELGFLE